MKVKRNLTKYEEQALRYAWENFSKEYGFEDSLEQAILYAPKREATILEYLLAEFEAQDIILYYMKDFLETKGFTKVVSEETNKQRSLTRLEQNTLRFAYNIKEERQLEFEDTLQWLALVGNTSEAIIIRELMAEFTFEELEKYLLDK